MANNEPVRIVCNCPTCGFDTSHIQLLMQKESKYGSSKKEKIKEFVDGFLSGTASPALASLELIDRHLICEKCGVRRIVNEGKELN